MPSELVPLLAQLLTALVSGGATIIAAYITVSHLRGPKPELNKAEVAQHKRPWHPLLGVVLVIAGWAIGGAIAVPLARTLAVLTWSSIAMGGAIGWAVGAAFAGFMTGQALRLAAPAVELKHILAVVIGWTAAGLIGGGLSWELAFSPLTGAISVTGGTIGGALAGATGGTLRDGLSNTRDCL
jgi:hypothetical protein